MGFPPLFTGAPGDPRQLSGVPRKVLAACGGVRPIRVPAGPVRRKLFPV